LAASPFILAGFIGSIFSGLLYLLLLWRREGLQELLPTPDVLDRVTYKTIGIAFPLLTLMIATGAYWANQAWGSYWSWDPKETWAAITWLVYAGYLHTRITRGWRGRRAAWFAIIGFAVVIFTFFGVTYLLPGMHAYASNG
jgi:cytochrome c-type biogenesis protein CcsB